MTTYWKKGETKRKTKRGMMNKWKGKQEKIRQRSERHPSINYRGSYTIKKKRDGREETQEEKGRGKKKEGKQSERRHTERESHCT